MSEEFIQGIVVFILAAFVGFEVIARVPRTIHTPLMSGANAISGITIVGAACIISTIEMAVAMNRSIPSILFTQFGGGGVSAETSARSL